MDELAGLVARLRAAGCVFAEDEARVLSESARDPAELDDLTAQRISGLPLEHVVGWAEFDGLRIAVSPPVFVPRQRSLRLVMAAVEVILGRASDAITAREVVVVDLCCGSGAIGRAVAHRVPVSHPASTVDLWAVDVDPTAVACAARNLMPVQGKALPGDLYAGLPQHLRGRVDLVLASPPYVPTEALGLMPPEARLHEPRRALDGGPDGLVVARRMLIEAATWLAPRGRVALEVAEDQLAAATAAARAAGLPAYVVGEASDVVDDDSADGAGGWAVVAGPIAAR